MKPTTLAIIILLIITIIYWGYKVYQSISIYAKYAYFDYNGTAPMRCAAIRALRLSLDLGNASAIYATTAKAILADTITNIRNWAGCDSTWQIIFTSGASESITTIIKGFMQTHPTNKVFCSAAEHAVTLANVTQPPLACNADSTINQAAIAQVLGADDLLTVMSANNETGAVTDIPTIYKLVQSASAFMHVDAVQTFGKFPNIARHCDAFSASAHKFGGPTGVGILAIRAFDTHPLNIAAMIPGKQQNGMRGGTENAAGIASMNVALKEIAGSTSGPPTNRYLTINQQLADKRIWLNNQLATAYPTRPLSTFIGIPDQVNPFADNQHRQIIYVPLLDPNTTESLPNTLSFSIIFTGSKGSQSSNSTPGGQFCNIIFRDQLLKLGCIVGIGSACNTGIQAPNHVLVAMGAPKIVRQGMIRISFGEETSWSDCRFLIKQMHKAIADQFN